MIAWMLYSAFVASIAAVAARAGEWIARVAGYPVRWTWAGAVALTVMLSGSAAWRSAMPAGLRAGELRPAHHANEAALRIDASWSGALSAGIENLRRVIDTPLQRAVATIDRVASPAADLYAATASALMTAALALVLAGVGRRFHVARGEWPTRSMHGAEVRVSPRIGPVVIGVVRPEIVVPHWLLTRRLDEQRLVVTHELEHIRARDPLLLGLTWGAVVVAPWNPAIWYMLSRLRLAVELDCDARVLRRGAAPQSYGALLIDVAQHASALRWSALALAGDASNLRQRILAMRPRTPRFARLRVGLAASFAFACVLAACQASLPSASRLEQLERTDVATTPPAPLEPRQPSHAVPAAPRLLHAPTKRDLATPARAATTAIHDTSRVQRDTSRVPRDTSRVPRDTSRVPRDTSRVPRPAAIRGDTVDRADSVRDAATAPARQEPPDLIIYIDGARSTVTAMRSLDRGRIEKVEVFKGRYAEQHYGVRSAATAVVVITTRPGGGTQ